MWGPVLGRRLVVLSAALVDDGGIRRHVVWEPVDRLASATAQSAELSSLGEIVTPTATPEEPKDLVEQHARDRSRQDDSDEWHLDIPREEVDADIVGVLDRDDDGEDCHDHADHEGHADTSPPEDRGYLATSLRRGHNRVRVVRRIRRGGRVADTPAGYVSSHEASPSSAAPPQRSTFAPV